MDILFWSTLTMNINDHNDSFGISFFPLKHNQHEFQGFGLDVINVSCGSAS